jgi:hypothetical protein
MYFTVFLLKDIVPYSYGGNNQTRPGEFATWKLLVNLIVDYGIGDNLRQTSVLRRKVERGFRDKMMATYVEHLRIMDEKAAAYYGELLHSNTPNSSTFAHTDTASSSTLSSSDLPTSNNNNSKRPREDADEDTASNIMYLSNNNNNNNNAVSVSTLPSVMTSVNQGVANPSLSLSSSSSLSSLPSSSLNNHSSPNKRSLSSESESFTVIVSPADCTTAPVATVDVQLSSST